MLQCPNHRKLLEVKMHYFTQMINKLLKDSHLKDSLFLFILFTLVSLSFALFMIFYENYSIIDTYYFLLTTATTVGYGDLSPQSTTGKILVTFYMIFSIAVLGIFLGKVADLIIQLNTKKLKGFYAMKKDVDLLIVGYAGAEKMTGLVNELRDDERFEHANIVNVNNIISEKEDWMDTYDVTFIKGIASDKNTLLKANIQTVKQALILANDPNKIESDDFSTSSCAVIKQINPKIKVIIEKVRRDNTLFDTVNADTVVDVTTANILAQEILDTGAIELNNAIFSNDTEGTQYNFSYKGESKTWKEVAILTLEKEAIAEGFKNPDKTHFNLMPSLSDKIENGALIKYRAKARISFD